MKMKSFKVENYRAILDSEWIETDDITVIVGKNESGKTSLLKALSKFNSSSEEGFTLSKEWPRNPRHQQSNSAKAKVVTVKFQFNDAEKQAIEELDELFKGFIEVEISCNYSNDFGYSFIPEKVFDRREIFIINQVIERYLTQDPENTSIAFKNRYQSALTTLKKKLTNEKTTVSAGKLVKEFKNKLPSFVSNKETDKEADTLVLPIITAQLDKCIIDLQEDDKYSDLIEKILNWMSVFIYMDDYKIFSGTAQLDAVKERKSTSTLTPEDQTFLTILNLSGLDLEKEVTRGLDLDKQQRAIDIRRASLLLTEKIAKRWTQKEYEVEFELDGQHFMTFVTDRMRIQIDEKTQSRESSETPVALEERSKGFQWFFSFDMNFMYETNGEYKNAILLLDEPGLHLHAAAQKDLLNRFEEYATNNQIIYTTHLPFMVNTNRFDNIVIAEEKNENGLKFHRDWAIANEDARYTLQAALGMTWSQFLFFNPYNLVVEGYTDFIYLTTISSLLNAENQTGIDPDLTITFAGGGTRAAYLATMLNGQKLKVAVLLDSDEEGNNARDQLVKEWIMKDDNVLLIGKLFNVQHAFSIEDLFPRDYYLIFVNDLYSSELKKTPLIIGTGDGSIVDLVSGALKARGITRKFNKGSVAKKIVDDLVRKTSSELSPIIQNFASLFETLNEIITKWKAK